MLLAAIDSPEACVCVEHELFDTDAVEEASVSLAILAAAAVPLSA
jgi:hypothetical protein